MSTDRPFLPSAARQRGITLVEQIIFIVVISVGVVGLLATFNATVQHSADPVIQKQCLAIAESLLTEILHKPMTWCDPDDPNASTATSAAMCANDQNRGGGALNGPMPAGEARNGAAASAIFDNVSDYAGYGQANATDANGGNAMAGYQTQVTITRAGLGPPVLATGDNGAALRVTVTVTRDDQRVTLTGYHFRYAPRY